MIVQSIRRHYPFPDDAEDLAHEVLLRVYNNFNFSTLVDRPAEERPKIIAAYFSKALKSVIHDQFRKEARFRGEQGTYIDQSSDASGEGFANSRMEKLNRPTVEELNSVLAAMPDHLREILYLHSVDCKSYPEIAAHYRERGQDVSLSALKMRFARAKRYFVDGLTRTNRAARTGESYR
jgi:RNA polymerase sigma factor (sigma-70 family)